MKLVGDVFYVAKGNTKQSSAYIHILNYTYTHTCI